MYNGASFKEATATVKLLKKYPNRRIYDTSTSSYITIADIRQMVLNYERFQVIDSKTGADLTRATLLQIITELESEGRESLLTDKVLEELIRFYGDNMSSLLGKYVEQAICGLINQQNKIREQVKQTIDKSTPLPLLSEMTKQYANFWKDLFSSQSSSKKGDE